jgi:hypothetical protein
MQIARASTADISFVMATERLPGNEGLVGRFEQNEHEVALADRSNAYSSVPSQENRLASSLCNGGRPKPAGR